MVSVVAVAVPSVPTKPARNPRSTAKNSPLSGRVHDASGTFDESYYERFYESHASRVYGHHEVEHLCRGVTELLAWYGADLRSVLDVGAGTGLWRDWFRKNKPAVRYRSTEWSAYACERYGHERRDISRWRAKERFDLVVCQGVLPYLDDDAAARAIENLAAMCAGFLYLEAITTRDLRDVVDRERTDTEGMRGRSGHFYKSRLKPHFQAVGCGLFYRRSGPLSFYELEATS
ncbi:MAG: class I SAM-dependent methyltransferase [Myxococcales bacterium]|nr:class I SAM-dependent methyltransferase [Myxococcales bacterium]